MSTGDRQILTGNVAHAKAYTQIAMGIGAIIGTILAAVVGSWFSRRWCRYNFGS